MTQKEKICTTIRELYGIGTAEAMKVAAELSAEAEKIETPREWLRAVWYSDECGGRLVRFKAGNPHGKKKILSDKKDRNEDEAPKKRLSASLSRTRRRIYEIAACNEWEWFFTGTLDGEKNDRFDLNATYKRISQYMRDFRRKQSGTRITYMIVPELHENGAWHFHGLLNGITEAELHRFSLDEVLPYRIRRMIEKGQDVYTWVGYAERFGYSTMTRVRSHAAVCRYVTKYITKDLLSDKQDSNRKLYYASRGLKKPELLAEGHSICGCNPDFDFENEWVALTAVTSVEEKEALLARYFGICPINSTDTIDKS